MAATGQSGQHVGGRPGRVAVVHGDPVTLARERVRHGRPDAPARPGHQDRPSIHLNDLIPDCSFRPILIRGLAVIPGQPRSQAS